MLQTQAKPMPLSSFIMSELFMFCNSISYQIDDLTPGKLYQSRLGHFGIRIIDSPMPIHGLIAVPEPDEKKPDYTSIIVDINIIKIFKAAQQPLLFIFIQTFLAQFTVDAYKADEYTIEYMQQRSENIDVLELQILFNQGIRLKDGTIFAYYLEMRWKKIKLILDATENYEE